MTTTLRILLVEDDSMIGDLAALSLRDLGVPHHIDHAFSADEALQLWHEQPYDLLMTDYNLRGKNGLELIAQLKAEGVTVPMVLFTAYDTPKLRRAAERAGVAAFLAKPFFFDDFVSLARSLLPIKTSEIGA